VSEFLGEALISQGIIPDNNSYEIAKYQKPLEEEKKWL